MLTTTKDRIADMKREISWAAECPRAGRAWLMLTRLNKKKSKPLRVKQKNLLVVQCWGNEEPHQRNAIQHGGANLDMKPHWTWQEAMGIVDEDSRHCL
jgi:hypothetical protein